MGFLIGAAMGVLWVNVAWDLLSASAMLAMREDAEAGWLWRIAQWHCGLWRREEDAQNRAARATMAWLCLVLAFMRAICALLWPALYVVGLASYALEAWFLASEALTWGGW